LLLIILITKLPHQRLCLINRYFKLKKRFFFTKASFLSFFRKCVLTIFRFFGPLEVLSIILQNEYFFLQIDFLNIKHTFRLLKLTLKHALSTKLVHDLTSITIHMGLSIKKKKKISPLAFSLIFKSAVAFYWVSCNFWAIVVLSPHNKNLVI
jgi:hypothetical protein